MDYCDEESNEISFKITNNSGGNTFTADSVQNIFSEIAKFIASRIVRAWQRDQGSAKSMTIRLRVDIE